jgi:hypothetical protein
MFTVSILTFPSLLELCYALLLMIFEIISTLYHIPRRKRVAVLDGDFTVLNAELKKVKKFVGCRLKDERREFENAWINTNWFCLLLMMGAQ